MLFRSDLDDGTGIQPIDDKAFTEVNDFGDVDEGFTFQNAEGEDEEADQNVGEESVFIDFEDNYSDDE